MLRFDVSSIQGVVHIKNSYSILLDYIRLQLLCLLWKTEPERILIVGLGVVEIDLEMMDEARQYFYFNENDYVRRVDEDIPVFNQRNDASEKKLDVDGISNDDIPNADDLVIEQPPSLSEPMKMTRSLQLLSTNQYPELHPYFTQLQSKFIDI
ncbi:unnamed protein product [Rotaria magnacalcarata]|uniref:Uncharacterized protein n=1 Tax=Rotaria magnacalcarata TaxID=392030 RepID=A0A816WY10_9BILA|nr:unnamed protein product [Rotaria magnacalcarata]CAF3733266.1 unnamed protein product [Rotaria magnacalcarata]